MKRKTKLFLLPFLLSLFAPLTSCHSETITLKTRYCTYGHNRDTYVLPDYDVIYGVSFTYPYGHVLTEKDVEEIITTSSKCYPEPAVFYGYHSHGAFSSSLDPIRNDLDPGLKLTEDVTYYYFAY